MMLFKSVRLNIVANYVGQGWSALMAIVFVPVYIKYLGLEAYGLVGVLIFMQTWFTLLDFGMTPTVNREMARFSSGERSSQNTRDLFRTIEWIVFGIGFLIAVIVWSISHWIASDWLKSQTLQTADVAFAVTLIGALVGLRFIEGVYRGAILGLQKHVWLNTATVVWSTLRWGGAALLLYVWTPTLPVFFSWQLLVSSCTIASFAKKIGCELPPGNKAAHFSLGELAGVWRFAGGSMVATCLAVLLTQLDKLMLSRLAPLEAFGYYTAAWTVAAGLYQLVTPITQVYFPKFTSLAGAQGQGALEAAYHQAAQFLTWIMVPPAFMLMFFSEPILLLWTNDVVLTNHAAPLVALFALGAMFNGFSYVPHIFALSAGWTRFGIAVNAISLFIFGPILAVAIYYHGTVGAASVWAVLNVACFLIGMQFFFRVLMKNDKWQWYLQDIGVPVAIAFFTCAIFRWIFLSGNVNINFIEILSVYLTMTLAVSFAIPRTRSFVMYFFRKTGHE